jgi:Tol biopolymer transport system component
VQTRRRAVAVTGCAVATVLPFAVVLLPTADAGTVAARAVPGDNGLVAFVSDRDGSDDIWTMAPDGSDQTRLTTSTSDERAPAWSPDGSRLVLERGNADGTDLYVVGRTGGTPVRLTEASGRDGAPAWSPDGTRIAFTSDRNRDDGYHDIYVMDADGTDETVLVAAPDGGTVEDPAWSPDGSQLAWVVDTDGSIPDTLVVAEVADPAATLELASSTYGVSHPDFSPDGTRLVFAAGTADSSLDVRTVARDGTDEQVLADSTDRESDPVFSPDGTTIAHTRGYADPSSPSYRVWTMDADGSGQVPVTDDVVLQYDGAPAWQPAPEVASVTVTPTSAAVDLGDEAQAVATALDAEGLPLAGATVLLRITGPHPATVTLVTDADGRARYSWEGSSTGTDTALFCADLDDDGTCDPTDPAASGSVLWSPPPPVDEPRLAFTDDSDALYAVDVRRVPLADTTFGYLAENPPDSFATELERFDAGPTHEGQAAGVPGTRPAFVSTRDDPRGEVYRDAAPPGLPTRVTCDPGAESHPVVSNGGVVAYASDADGDWDVYVSIPPPEVPGRPAALTPPAELGGPGRSVTARATACDPEWTTTNVTDEADGEPPRDDLWPSFTYDATSSALTTGIVYSSAAAGELPDLHWAQQEGAGYEPPVALTSTPQVAETQPAAMVQAVADPDSCPDPDEPCFPTSTTRSWVAFTTTDLRSSGTLALLDLADPDVVVRPDTSFRSATEAAWSSIVNPRHLAATSTANDPYGDVVVADVPPATLVGDSLSDAEVLRIRPVVSALPTGLAESHPFWLRTFGDSLAQPATLVFTGRAADPADLAGDARVLHADVSDVLATDGSQRRVLRRARELDDGEVVHRHDEAGPSYSPDGSRFVYSDSVRSSGADAGTRVLVVAEADGSGAVPLLPDGQREPYDVDVDPVWSPDGRKVAFVRVRRYDGETPPDPPEVWVYRFATGVATRMVGGGGADLSPAWAPDSRHLVVARNDPDGSSDPGDAARRSGTARWPSTPLLHVLDTDAPAGPGYGMDYCGDGCTVSGRSPAWSPDGRRIAYEDDGQLRTVAFAGPCCTASTLAVDAPVTLVGIDDVFPTGDVATPSRSVVGIAQDPAWSPDGSEIAFAGQPVGQPDAHGIWGIAPDGSGLRRITDGPGPETEPAYQDRRGADVAVTVSIGGSPALVDTPVVATYVVTNLGPVAATNVSLTTAFAPGAVLSAPAAPAGCRVDGTGCDLPALGPGASRVYTVRLRHPARVLGVATGTVVADQTDPDLANNSDSALYRVQGADVRVRITLDEPVGHVGGVRTAVVTVRNLGSDPVDDVVVRATWPIEVVPFVPPVLPAPAAPRAPDCLVLGEPCAIGTVGAGGRRRFRVGLETLVEATVQLEARVSTSTEEVSTTDNVDTVALEVLQPEIQLLPGVAPPGKVVLAYGVDFPPGSLVSIEWEPGITVTRTPALVSPTGTLRVPVLVVRHDLLGARLLTATSEDDLFTPVDGDLLVVPRTLSPPTFNGRG